MAKIYALKSKDITQEEREHMELSRKVAEECIVLLENKGVLPFSEKGYIALYGNGARRTVKGGTGSGDVNVRISVSIEQAFCEAGYQVVTQDWMDRFDRKVEKEWKAYKVKVQEIAKKENIPEIMITFTHPFTEPEVVPIEEGDIKTDVTDTAVYVISRNSGEGSDRRNEEGDYLLWPQERENLIRLGKAYQNVVVVLNIGGVMDLTQIKEIPGIGGIVLMSQLGNMGGYALVDMLSGAVTPSGRLTDTWAVRYEDYPSSAGFSHNDGNVNDEYYTEGIYVGYRYFDSFGVETLYPFGYGKSYTSFALETKGVEQKKDKIEIRISVTNTGKTFCGKEVVQVYFSAPQGSVEKPFKELLAYGKTKLLSPGESQILTLTFPIARMASYYEEEAAWVLDPGVYLIRVGANARDTEAAAELFLAERVKTQQLKNLFAPDHNMTEISAGSKNSEETKHKPGYTIVLEEKDIPCKKVVYQGKRQVCHTEKSKKLTMEDIEKGYCTVEELTAQLSVEELACYCVGNLRTAEEGSIVGNASDTVPGAAGDTSTLLKKERGIENLIMADGPAGLRLQPHFKADKDGNILPGGEIFGDCESSFLPCEQGEGVEDYYQYCTAIPIGWALAQSWNEELLEQIGDVVGQEMEQFHIDLWLAPALNIHRNPLCGRNFEYYSEDPLVSGKTAAAIIRGVQGHHGKGTTIKHFAANNQEDNRYFTNAHVSERALREIYLRGFEIAIREGKPMAVMTSYNLINGIHAANCYDLIQSVARDEWQFEGLVMTDWYTSQNVLWLAGGHETAYPISASTGCIFAGNDLQMPGCEKNVEDIVKAVKEATEIDGYAITLGDLQFNAAHVIGAVLKCRGQEPQ